VVDVASTKEASCLISSARRPRRECAALYVRLIAGWATIRGGSRRRMSKPRSSGERKLPPREHCTRCKGTGIYWYKTADGDVDHDVCDFCEPPKPKEREKK
jgi:hypothetical protein